MPRPPKPENALNPVRLLRRALADKNQAVATQGQLSTWLGVPVETIKSLEAGRRRQGALNDRIIDAALIYLGARWNPKKSQWENLLGQSYNRSHLELWRSADFDRDDVIRALKEKLTALLLSTPDRSFPMVTDMLCDAINKVQDHFQFPMKKEDARYFEVGLGLVEFIDGDGKVICYKRQVSSSASHHKTIVTLPRRFLE
jgi:hypothetical protein